MAVLLLITLRRASEGDAEATVNVEGIVGDAQKKYVRKTIRKIQNDIAGQSAYAKRKYGDLEQFYVGCFDLRLDADAVKILNSDENETMCRGGTRASHEGRDFAHLASLMKSKNVVFPT